MFSKDYQHIVLHRNDRKLILRKSLFWDLPDHRPDPDKNRRLIMERVFTRGTLQEVKGLGDFYSDTEIRSNIVQIGSLDKRTLNFLSNTYHISPTAFKCCTQKP